MTPVDERTPQRHRGDDPTWAEIDGRASAVGAPETLVVVDSRPRVVVGLFGVVVVMALAVAGLAIGQLGGSETAQTPRRFELIDVGDGTMMLDDAVAKLEALGLVVDTEYVPNERLQRGTVFEQDPPALAKVEQGSVVKLLVSDGPSGTAVPGVVNQQVGDAMLSLAGLNLLATVVEVPDERVRPGEVLLSKPLPGERIAPGGTVTLVVSSGPPPRTVPVMVGRKVEEVLVDLGRAGLAVGSIDRPYRTDVAAGTVIEATPAAGSAVPRDMPINLVVATDRPPIPVPYLVGLRSSSAQILLKNAGLVAAIALQPVDPGSPQVGAVVGQGVPPWSKVAPGTTVEITVGDPSAPPSTTTPPLAPTTSR